MTRFREWQEVHYARLFRKLDRVVDNSWPCLSLPHVTIDGRHYWSAKRRLVFLGREGNYAGPFAAGGWQHSLLANRDSRGEIFPTLRAYWQETIDRRASGGARDRERPDWHAQDWTESKLFWQVMWDYAGALGGGESRRRFDRIAWANLYRVSAAWEDEESFESARAVVRELATAKRLPDTLVDELTELEPDVVVDCTQAHNIVDRILDKIDPERELLHEQKVPGGRVQCERVTFSTGDVSWVRVPHFSYGTRPSQASFVVS